MTESRFRVPHTLVLLFGMILLAFALTQFLQQGAFERVTNSVGREQVIPASYTPLEHADRLPPSAIFTSIPHGFEAAGEIIFFIFIIGGAFGVFRATGAADAAIGAMLRRLGERPAVLIAGGILLFAVGSSTIGMAEEYLPFVPLIVALALALGMDEITGVAVKKGARHGGVQGRQALGDESGDHPCENVTHPGGSHAGIPGRIDKDLACGSGYDGRGSLEDDDDPVFLRKLLGQIDAVFLHFRRSEAEKTGEFSGVGSDDDLGATLQEEGRGIGQGVEAVGVDDQGQADVGNEVAYKAGGFRVTRETRPEGHDVLARQGFEYRFAGLLPGSSPARLGKGKNHRLREGVENGSRLAFGKGDGDEAAAGTQRSPGGENRCPRKSPRPRQEEGMSEHALVARPGPVGEEEPDVFPGDEMVGGEDPFLQGEGKSDVAEI